MNTLSIDEATQLGITKLTRAPWNPMAHLRLNLVQGAGVTKYMRGPWFEIWDMDLDKPGRLKKYQSLLFTGVDSTERAWTPWQHPRSWMKDSQ